MTRCIAHADHHAQSCYGVLLAQSHSPAGELSSTCSGDRDRDPQTSTKSHDSAKQDSVFHDWTSRREFVRTYIQAKSDSLPICFIGRASTLHIQRHIHHFIPFKPVSARFHQLQSVQLVNSLDGYHQSATLKSITDPLLAYPKTIVTPMSALTLLHRSPPLLTPMAVASSC